MNRERSRKKESPFCTTRRFLLFSVAACLAVVPFLYSRSESNEKVVVTPPIIPLSSTLPVPDLGSKYQDVLMQAPQTRSLKGVDETTGEVQDPSFLADVLPLKLLRILPSTQSVYSSSDVVQLYGRTALLAVFNRAVIPLGGDWEQYSDDLSKAPFTLEGLPSVPGKFRWVTTSIARFDPDVDWPTDLQFTLKIKPDIKAYDGTPLTVGAYTATEQKYETHSLSFSISHVDSPKTRNLTNGLWASRVGNELSEVPPDGKITLHFNHEIDYDAVSKALIIYQSGSPKKTVKYQTEKCGKTCLHLTLQTKLGVDTTYSIQLPEGTKYHPYAGSLRQSATAEFTGLRSFKFDWTEMYNPGANRYHLWLRHGLDPSVTMDKFASSIVIKEDDKKFTSWTLDRPHAAVLRITGNFNPQKVYKVSVKGNSEILDGYQLSLQNADTSFTTNMLPTYAVEPQSEMFENDFASDWELFVRARKGQGCSGAIVQNVNKDNVVSVLQSFYNYYDQNEKPSANSNYKGFPTDLSNNSIITLKNEEVFGKSGTLYSFTRCEWPKKSIVSRTDYAVAFADHRDKFTAWVTSMSSGEPVADATADIYAIDIRYGNKISVTATLVGSKFTDESGLAVFSRMQRNQLAAVITVGDTVLIIRDLPSEYFHPEGSTYETALLSDRSIYRLGETIHLKGYVNQYNMDTLSTVVAPDLKQATITASFDHQSEISVTAQIDPEYGSFNTTLEVPYSANYGPVTIQVTIDTVNNMAWGSTTITIADPRLPTATLDFHIEESTFKPQRNEIPVTIETKSYTGNPIPDAEVTLRWSLNRQYQMDHHNRWEWWSWWRPFYVSYASQEIFGVGLMPNGKLVENEELSVEGETATQKDQGTIVIKTGAAGKVEHKFTLPAEMLSRPVTDEDTLSFEVEWIGPTREKLSQSLSRRVAHSDWKLGVQLPTSEVIPGFPFDVLVRLLDSSQSDSIIEGQQVDLVLYEWDGKTPLIRDPVNGVASLPDHFNKISACEYLSSSEKLTNCTFTLPEARQYVLIASTTDPSSYSVVTAVPVGKSPEDWKHSPLGHLPTSQMVWPDKEEYSYGETASLTFYAPRDGRALVFWGNRLADQSMELPVQPEAGKATIDIPIGKECIPDGCTVDIVLSLPRDHNISLPVEVPASPLLDIGLPKQIHLRTTLKVADQLLQVLVDIKPQDEVVRPGSTTSIDVTLTTSEGQPVSGEVALWLVDQSIYDLMPSPPANLTQRFHKSFRDVYKPFKLSTEALRSEKALKNAREILLRRMGLDHWIVPAWELYSPSDLELADEEFFVKHFTQMTKFPGSYYHPHIFRGAYAGVTSSRMEKSAPMMEVHQPFLSFKESDGQNFDNAVGSAAPPSAGQGIVIRSSSNFEMTPVFMASIKVDSTGKISLPIKLPDNIGTFKIFATAVSSQKKEESKQSALVYGIGESSVISRHPLSIQPSVPRIARLGDTFQAGVTITVTEPETDITQVQVTAHITDGSNDFIQLVKSSSTTVSVKQTQPLEVVFDFEALRLGDAIVRFTAEVNSDKSGKYSDGLEVTIPVLGLQEPVLVATSFSLDGKPATVVSSQEGLKLPNAVPGSGNVTLEAGVGRLPAILMLSEGIFNLAHRFEAGITVLSRLAPKAALQAYWDGLSPATKENLEAEHQKALELIDYYTTEQYGLGYFHRDDNYWQSEPSLHLNGMALLQHKLMQKVSDVTIPSHITDAWSRAFQLALAESIKDGYLDNFWASVFFYLYGPTASLPVKHTTFGDFMVELDSYSCHVACKALAAMTIMDNSVNTQQKALNDIVAYLESSIRVQGRTAYVTYNLQGGSAHAASKLDNAMALWALSTFNYNTKASLNVLIEKLANYLGATAASHGFYATDSAFVALSLCSYDMMKGSTTPNVKLTVQSGDNVLLNELFDSPSDPVVKKKHSWEVLADTIEVKLLWSVLIAQFDAMGQGEVSVAVGLQFIPSELFNTNIYRGIYVEKTIQLIDPFTHEPVGPSLTQIPTGKTVKVTLQVTTPDDLSTVVLIDPVPAGLEPIDPNISPASGMRTQFSGFTSYACYDCWWPWFAFPRQETMKDQVKFISGSLRAGTHTVSYEALAVTSGQFTVPPAKAFVLNQPEVMGLSASGSLVVNERL